MVLIWNIIVMVIVMSGLKHCIILVHYITIRVVNLMLILAGIIGLFCFSIIVPTWKYNMICEIAVGTPIPCEYKIVFLPQLIILLLIVLGVCVWFSQAFKRKPMYALLYF